jgi:hypothetical protein
VVDGCLARQRQRRELSGRASSSEQDVAPSTVSEMEHILISSPSASGMRSLTLHPRAYRNLPNIASISDLAKALHVHDLRRKMRSLQKHPCWPVAERALVDFRNLSGTADESVVNSEFSHLMKTLSFTLGFKCSPDSQRRFGVGGILAESNYAYRGRSDTPFVVRERVTPLCPAHGINGRCKEVDESGLSEGVTVLTCEFKTVESFPYGRVWYHGSRGHQVLGGLWSGWLRNPFAPALLLSPAQFKLFIVRNPGDRTCACARADWNNDGDIGLMVHQYPADYDSGVTTSYEFLQMLVLILSATTQEELHTPKRRLHKRGGIKYRQKVTATPDSGDLPTVKKMSPRGSRGDATEMRQPAFSEGCSTVGQTVWFVKPERLAELEWDKVLNKNEPGQREADKKNVQPQEWVPDRLAVRHSPA